MQRYVDSSRNKTARQDALWTWAPWYSVYASRRGFCIWQRVKVEILPGRLPERLHVPPTSEDLVAEVGSGDPLVFLVKGASKNANQQLVGFIPLDGPNTYKGDADRELEWSIPDPQVPNGALKVTQGDYGRISISAEADCFLGDVQGERAKQFRKASLRLWDFGLYTVKGYAFFLTGPAPWVCLSDQLKVRPLSLCVSLALSSK